MAHSTSAAVQKLSLKTSTGETSGDKPLSYSEPNVADTLTQDPALFTSAQPLPLQHHVHSTHLMPDSQGYSSGDEASNVGSPRRPVQTAANTDARSTLTTAPDQEHHPNLHTTHAPQQPTLADMPTPSTSQFDTSPTSQLHTPSTTPHTTPFTHTPANISYPNGYSSAEKAAYVARLVADSTGSAVQKLSETMAERNQQLSLSHKPSPPSTDPADS